MKRITEPCPHCGQPMPAERRCARPDCGLAFQFRRSDAVYCTARCARVMAQRAYRKRLRRKAARTEKL